jgi:hypothetical protein
MDLVKSQIQLFEDTLKVCPVGQLVMTQLLVEADHVEVEIQPQPLPDLSPVPPFVVGHVKQVLSGKPIYFVPQHTPPVGNDDHMFGLLHTH